MASVTIGGRALQVRPSVTPEGEFSMAFLRRSAAWRRLAQTAQTEEEHVDALVERVLSYLVPGQDVTREWLLEHLSTNFVPLLEQLAAAAGEPKVPASPPGEAARP